jgi:N-acetylglucosaminyldiphosphoundecaprenol N-acetyl-beta-D-mannosaminyltransferase
MRILNIRNLDTSGEQAILDFCRHRIAAGEGAFLVPVNPIKVVKARRSPGFQEIIDGADLVFPDAWGMRWAARLLHGKIIPLVPGWQMMLSLLAQAEREGDRVYLLGASPESLGEAVEKLGEKYPRLTVAGTHHGYYAEGEEDEVFRRIAESRPDYVFVAMGEEKQERVIARLRKRCPKAVLQGVGGSVDLLAGRQPTPPEWMRRRHLEWVYRFFRQPFRIPRFRALPVFVVLVWREKLRMLLRGGETGGRGV